MLEGCELDANFKGLDVLPLVSPAAAVDRVASSQPPRLRLNGRARFSGRVTPPLDATGATAFAPS